MVYCMSDIHGELDRFHAMLDLINFSSSDTLYILGDVIDRHPSGVDILKMIMDTPNMFMLLGNHEQMCLDTLGPLNTFGSRQLWQGNGGSCTYRELLYVCTPAERKRILRFLGTLPDHLDVDVGPRKFHLVHAMPSDNPDERIWSRPKPNDPPYFKDRIVIVSHTPTCYMSGDHKTPFTIWHGNGLIDIDCGFGNKTELRRLACLRLDDLKEFYI